MIGPIIRMGRRQAARVAMVRSRQTLGSLLARRRGAAAGDAGGRPARGQRLLI